MLILLILTAFPLKIRRRLLQQSAPEKSRVTHRSSHRAHGAYTKSPSSPTRGGGRDVAASGERGAPAWHPPSRSSSHERRQLRVHSTKSLRRPRRTQIDPQFHRP